MMSALPPRSGESPARARGAGVSRLALMQVSHTKILRLTVGGWIRALSCIMEDLSFCRLL